MTTWFVNIDGDPCWLAYSTADSKKMEAAHAKKQKGLLLNDTYKIDFHAMRQVRRDDPDRWRTIKRGGLASDPPVVADDEVVSTKDPEEEEEEEEAAPKKRAPAAKKKPAKKTSDDDEPTPEPEKKPAPEEKKAAEEKKPAAAASAPPPAAKAAPVVAPPVAAASSAASEKLIATLKQQLADSEAELTAAETAASLAKQRADKEKGEAVAAVRKEMMAALQEAKKLATKAAMDAAALQLQTKKDLDAAQQALYAAEEAECEVATLREEIGALRAQYSQLITVIKPVAAAFGLPPESPISKAIAAFESKQAGGAAKTPAVAKTKPAPAPAAAAAPKPSPAPAAASHKRRAADSDDEAAVASDAEDARHAAAKKPRSVSPAAAAAASDADTDAGADADATQPMFAPKEDADAAMDETDDGGSAAPAPPFLTTPTTLTASPIALPANRIPLSFGQLPVAAPPAGVSYVLVGSRASLVDLLAVNAHSGATTIVAQTGGVEGRPAHRFNKPAEAKTADGVDDESKLNHVHALCALPIGAADRAFLLLTGEGRLLRSYLLQLNEGASASAAASSFTLKFVQEFDVGEGSWVTCMRAVKVPATAGHAATAAAHVAVGVSGSHHVVQLYRSVAASLNGVNVSALKLERERSYPVRCDEVRAVVQLPGDGRIVIATCSNPIAGELNEGGSVELWPWQSDGTESQRSFLKNDLKVHSDIGLRCNDLQAWREGGSDYLLAAFEYCSNGERRLTLFNFDSRAGGSDLSAKDIELKNQPPLSENTFTSLAVSADHQRAAALTFGGKLLIFDLAGRRRLTTLTAHAESVVFDDGAHLFIGVNPRDGTQVLLSAGGNKELKLIR